MGTENTSMTNSFNGTQRKLLFYQERLKVNDPVKNSINGTTLHGSFLGEGEEVENSTKSKQGTVIFSYERGRTENTSVKNSVNNTQGTVLFSPESGKLK